MEHVRKQGVTNVREVEDVLLAHLGLVPTLERTGRPASARDLDERLCARLKIDNVAELSDWLAAQHATVERQLQLLAWQSWGTDNQIIASVQTLVDATVQWHWDGRSFSGKRTGQRVTSSSWR